MSGLSRCRRGLRLPSSDFGGYSPTRRNVRKVLIRVELGLDFGFWVIGKVLILLGFGVGDVGKVFISNK